MADNRNLQPLLESARRYADAITGASDSLDSKALGVLGFNLALVIFALQSVRDNPAWLLIAMLLQFAVSSILTIVIIWPRNYAGPYVPLSTHPENLNLPEEQLLLQLIANTEQAAKINAKPTFFKRRCCIAALCFSLAGAGLLIWCIL